MGSEQSSQGGVKNSHGRNKNSTPLRREKTLPGPSSSNNDDDERCVSPEQSTCSDSDLPYISYTVNRPIGDSPKLSAKQAVSLQRGKSLGSAVVSTNRKRIQPRKSVNAKSSHDIVVVKPGKERESGDKDPHLQKLQEIPMFLPIMRATLNLPGMRDPEVLEKLDPQDILGLCKKVQQYMTLCSEHVSSSQNQITGRIREVEFELCRMVSSLGERQKRISKIAEKMSVISELSHQLNRCHSHLNKTLELIEDLNNKLPLESRLEPFVWTTG